MFCKNSQRLNTGNYFCKKLHLWCFTGFWIRLRLSSLHASLFFLLFLPLWKFRSGRSQMSFKKEVFKKIAIFTGKPLCWSLFVMRLPAYKPANLLKRDSNTSIFLLMLLNIAKQLFFIEYPRWMLFKAMFETRQNFTMKNEKGFY